jgi:hypothetical protein
LSRDDRIDFEKVIKLHREYVDMISWLDVNKSSIFRNVAAKNKNYAAICENPPTRIHFFEEKSELIRFLQQNLQAVYIFRYHDEMTI